MGRTGRALRPGQAPGDPVQEKAEAQAELLLRRRGPTGRPASWSDAAAGRPGRGPLLVVWDHRDPFDGEDEPPAEVTWPWPAPAATVTDVFGRTSTVSGQHGQIRLPVSVTPLLVEAPGRS